MRVPYLKKKKVFKNLKLFSRKKTHFLYTIFYLINTLFWNIFSKYFISTKLVYFLELLGNLLNNKLSIMNFPKLYLFS